MLTIYIKIAFRNLWKNKLFSAINITGLTFSMAVGLIFVLTIKSQFEFDHFQPYPDRTYRIITSKLFENGTDIYATSPAILARKLESYSFVEKSVQLSSGETVAASDGNKELALNIKYTTPTFLTLFNFELTEHNNNALDEPNSIIISEQKAEDFWGKANPVGKVLNLPGKGNFKITGVIKTNKQPTHFNFDALVSAGSSANTRQLTDSENWANTESGYTYVLLKKGAGNADLQKALAQISGQTGSFLKTIPGNKSTGYQFIAQNILEINPASHSMIIGEMNRGLDWSAILIISGLVLLLLLMAGFNYTSLSLAKSINRAREVGVRKINGAKRHQIFAQFLTETVFLTFLSAGLALLLIPPLGNIPLFGEILATIQIDGKSTLWVIGFALLVSLIAGGLPAWLLSAFDPMVVLKKLTNHSILGGIGFRKALIVVQFTVTTIFITFLVISKEQTDFERHFDYGFSPENLVYVTTKGEDIPTLINGFSQIASVKSVSATSGLPLRELATGSCFVSNPKNADSLKVDYYSVDENFLTNLNIKLVAGTNFPANLSGTDESSVILNEKAIKQLNFKNPGEAIGRFVQLDSAHVQIIGVYKDFINWNLRFGSMPFALRYKPSEFNQVLIKIDPGNPAKTTAALESVWKKLYPKNAFHYEFYDSFMESRIANHEKDFVLIDFLTGLVLSIACLGLVGMVSYSVEVRIKEIGIRRTLGAAGVQLIWLISHGFIKVLLWAGILGLPVGYYIGHSMLKSYAYRIDLSAGLFLTSFLSMFLIGLATILSQTYRASYVNPVESLRSE
ncbi:ABC transporter permease [Dyadobacter pollutisoli]|uniref:ABC transporter permease n=1 Tax=Dyadobacter pollutisoli TaxID=2910158 RepID=A0A9E8NDS6_9BACT|nr:ABC transporter permease [Dyadobacter pollutisoli]WAC12656.1 ABC transporter permease [Dyadobacter pollutisoli]